MLYLLHIMIKKLVLITSLLLYFATAINAQNWVWAQRYGMRKGNKVSCVKTDDSGYVYIAGYFTQQITLGTNALPLVYTINSYSKEAFIAKLDSNGYCYWARSGGSIFDDRVLGMAVDSAGNSIIVGTYYGTTFTMGSVVLNNSGLGGGDQGFIMKHDRNGNLLWGRFAGSKSYGDDHAYDAVFDKNGNAYIVGFITGDTITCNGQIQYPNVNLGTTLTHKQCYWLTKVDANGAFQWIRTFGNLPWDPIVGKYVERDAAICTDDAGNIYATAGFDGTNKKFGTDIFSSVGGHDIFVTKYDTSGNYIWTTKGGSNKDDWSNGICADKQGHIYITGEHRDSLIVDTVLVKNYDKRDVFVMKLDAGTGKPIWGKRAGSNLGGERGNDIIADEYCNVYVCGDINEGAKFGDKIIVPTGRSVEAFVARISPEGKWMWVATGGGIDSNDRCNSVAKGKGKQLYAVGFFRVNATFGGTTLVINTATDSSDGFYTRLDDSMLNKGADYNLNYPSKTTLCFGDTAHLKVPKHGFLSILPGTGFTTNSDTTQLIFSPNTTTTYTIIGASAGVCVEYDTISFTMNVSSKNFQLFLPADTVICAGESIVYPVQKEDFLQVTPMNGVVFNSDSTQITFSPSVTTKYQVFGYILGACPVFDSVSFTVKLAPSPNINFEVTPKIALIQDPIFTLTNYTTGASSYQWFLGTNLFSISTSTTVKQSEPGEYCYKLIAESMEGCIDSGTSCGSIIKDERVFFPNAFSPNGDFKNEEFKAFLYNIELDKITDFSILIANRFGEIVFKSNNPALGWDGNLKTKKCDIGTYYYVCKFTTPEGKKYDLKGDLILIR
jgi:gliding motility-associated-like protein